jgi:hypothetical protein
MFEYQGFNQDGNEGQRTLKNELKTFFEFWYQNRDFLETLDRNSMLDKIIEVSVNIPIKDFVSLSKFLPDDNEWARTRIFKFAVCGLVTSMLDWYHEGFKTSMSDMVDLSCRVLSHPLFPNLDKLGIQI